MSELPFSPPRTLSGWPAALNASHHTISGVGIRETSRFTISERREAAARAGFSGIGLRIGDYREQARLHGSDADAEPDGPSVPIVELEMLFNWDSSDSTLREQSLADERLAYELADRHGSRLLNVGVATPSGHALHFTEVARSFADLCARASDHGLTVALEFMPWSAMDDIESAARIVELSGSENAGILLDAWHYFRGPSTDRQLAAAAERIVSIQVDDAPDPALPDPFIDSVTRRALPGKGALPLREWFDRLRELGVGCPVSVEVISSELQSMRLQDAADAAYLSTLTVL